MKKYSVQFMVYASMNIQVEAENESEARALAEDKAFEPTLCHHCSDDLDIGSVGEITEVIEIE